MTSPDVARAARLLAGQQRARVASARDPFFRATVSSVTAGAARDGNALVKITYLGTQLTVNDYPDSYTPVVNHRVLCAWVGDTVAILHRSIGQP